MNVVDRHFQRATDRAVGSGFPEHVESLKAHAARLTREALTTPEPTEPTCSESLVARRFRLARDGEVTA